MSQSVTDYYKVKRVQNLNTKHKVAKKQNEILN